MSKVFLSVHEMVMEVCGANLQLGQQFTSVLFAMQNGSSYTIGPNITSRLTRTNFDKQYKKMKINSYKLQLFTTISCSVLIQKEICQTNKQ